MKTKKIKLENLTANYKYVVDRIMNKKPITIGAGYMYNELICMGLDVSNMPSVIFWGEQSKEYDLQNEIECDNLFEKYQAMIKNNANK